MPLVKCKCGKRSMNFKYVNPKDWEGECCKEAKASESKPKESAKKPAKKPASKKAEKNDKKRWLKG